MNPPPQSKLRGSALVRFHHLGKGKDHQEALAEIS